MTASSARAQRLLSEQTFFDREAAGTEVAPISAAVLDRYARCSFATRCFPFGSAIAAALPKARGGTVLDIGCGLGSDSLLFSHLGAREVVGIDLSEQSIALAEKRAAVSSGIGSVRFVVGDVGDPRQQESLGQFDLVWCSAILHHVIPELEATVRALRTCVRPGGRLVIKEPVAPSRALRRARLAFAPHSDATDDERPLETDEIDLIRSVLPGAQVSFGRILGRATSAMLRGSYESAASLRKAAAVAINVADAAVSVVPGAWRLSSNVLIVWDAP